MKTTTCQKRLEKKGYTVTKVNGGYIASRHGRIYSANTLNGLYKKILG